MIERGGGGAFVHHRGVSAWRRERIFAYLDPWSEEHALGKAYQLSHSLIAFGRGEIFGVGPGRQRREAALPARGAHRLPARRDRRGARPRRRRCSSIALFLWLTRAPLAHRPPGDRARPRVRRAWWRRASASGSACQTFINMGVNLGVLPTKGLTLPLMSFGGSAILMNVVALAVVLRIDYREPSADARRSRMSRTAARHGGRHRWAHLPGPRRAPRCASAAGACSWLGTPGSMEHRLVPPRGFAFEPVALRRRARQGPVSTPCSAPMRLLRAFWQSLARRAPRAARCRAGHGRLRHASRAA